MILKVSFKLFGTDLEKVIMQSQADVEQQRHGNPLMLEALIDVLRRAMYLLGKPSGGASLTLQLLLNHRSNMKSLIGHHTY